MKVEAVKYKNASTCTYNLDIMLDCVHFAKINAGCREHFLKLRSWSNFDGREHGHLSRPRLFSREHARTFIFVSVDDAMLPFNKTGLCTASAAISGDRSCKVSLKTRTRLVGGGGSHACATFSTFFHYNKPPNFRDDTLALKSCI
jgi:hypothetical protein